MSILAIRSAFVVLLCSHRLTRHGVAPTCDVGCGRRRTRSLDFPIHTADQEHHCAECGDERVGCQSSHIPRKREAQRLAKRSAIFSILHRTRVRWSSFDCQRAAWWQRNEEVDTTLREAASQFTLDV